MTHPSIWRGFVIAATLGLGLWSLATLQFQTELLPVFPQDLESVRLLKKAQATVSSEREIIVVAQPNPGWQVMQKLAEHLKSVPGIGEVHVGFGSNQSPTQWMAALIAGLPADRFAEVQQALAPSQIQSRLADTLQQLSGAIDESEIGRLHFDPLQLQEIAFPRDASSPGLTLTNLPAVLTIVANRPLKTFEDDQKFVALARGEINKQAATLAPSSQFMLTGQIAITADVSRHMKRDLIVMLAFTIVLTSLTFWLFYRSLVPLLWIIAAQLLALFCALTVARLLLDQINILSIGFSSILLGVGMDYCILVYHFFSQPGEVDLHEWRELRRAIWLSSWTTAATFGILYFSSFPGLRQLAILVSSGLVATAFFATTFLADHLAVNRPQAPGVLQKVSDACSHFFFSRREWIVATVFIFVLGIAALSPRWISYHFYDSSLEALEPLQLESTRAGKILQAQMPHPVSVNIDADQNRQSWVPVNLLGISKAFQSAGLDASWSGATLEILASLNRWHAGTLDLTGPAQANAAWLQLRKDLNATAVVDFKRLSLLMLGIVILLCAITHRSGRLVGLNLSALFLSLLLLGSMLYFSGNSLTLVSLLCIPLTIGLVIDYSLHILLALEHAKGSVVIAFRHLGIPVLLTGLASIIGFTAPLLSSQPALQNFGTVMDLGVIAAVLSGLVFLPALYSVTRSNATAPRPPTIAYSRSLYCASILSIAVWLSRRLPLRITRLFGAFSGRLYGWTHPARIALLERNLSLLEAGRSPEIAREVYPAFGQTLADYFHIGTRSRDEAMKIISQQTGLQHLHDVACAGQGGIIVTAHFGLFELGGLFTAAQGFPVDILTFPEPSKSLTEWRAQFRKQWGVETIQIGNDPFAFLPIVERLQQNHFIAALIDRPGPSETVDVRMPNGITGFSSGILLLAAHTGTPVIPATMARLRDGTYHACIHTPITITHRGSRAETLAFYSQQIADILIPDLCEHPEQWYQFIPLSRSSS